MIYLASPYSHPDPEVRHHRYAVASAHTAKRLKQKKVMFSPIVYGHHMAMIHGLPKDAAWWMDFNMSFLAVCSGIEVLTMSGWRESKGVKIEIEVATEIGLPILYTKPLE